MLAGAAQQQRGALLHAARRVAPAASAWSAQLSSKVGLQGSLRSGPPIAALRPSKLLRKSHLLYKSAARGA